VKIELCIGDECVSISDADYAWISLQYARTGDMSHIANRLRLNMLSESERQFLADYLLGKVKPRRLRRNDSPFKKSMICCLVVILRAQDWKQEAAIKKACQIFHVKRSFVFDTLKGIDYPKKIAERKEWLAQTATSNKAEPPEVLNVTAVHETE
jgi:hypothetical protein